ncbi:MAG: hypothetical protein H3C47_03065 [Candidatus Cloacimonetes bacterium]|nr:hypothetical protein [Candidatus Cloacimonadota bacterium]
MKSLASFVLSLILLSISHANQPVKSTSGKFQAGTYIGGQLVPVTYSYTVEQEPIFQSNRFHIRKAKIIAVTAPNQIRAEVAGRERDFTLIGLMDFSMGINGSLRQFVIQRMQRELPGLEVTLYLPKDFKQEGLSDTHVYILHKEKLINYELLQQGLGILPENQAFYGPLLEAFDTAMREAANQNLGIWGTKPNHKQLSDEELSKHGIIREP